MYSANSREGMSRGNLTNYWFKQPKDKHSFITDNSYKHLRHRCRKSDWTWNYCIRFDRLIYFMTLFMTLLIYSTTACSYLIVITASCTWGCNVILKVCKFGNNISALLNNIFTSIFCIIVWQYAIEILYNNHFLIWKHRSLRMPTAVWAPHSPNIQWGVWSHSQHLDQALRWETPKTLDRDSDSGIQRLHTLQPKSLARYQPLHRQRAASKPDKCPVSAKAICIAAALKQSFHQPRPQLLKTSWKGSSRAMEVW